MDKFNDVTRLLCASVILLGATFRNKLTEHFEQKYVATAPEIGLDMRLLMQVVALIEDWEEERSRIRRRFGWIFLALAIILVIVFAVSRSSALTLIVLFAVGAVIQWRQSAAQEQYDPETLLDHFKRRNYDPDKIQEVFGHIPLKPDIESGMPKSSQNVVVYSGFLPFIGAGINLDHWSFATNVTYGKEDPLSGQTLDPISFEVAELYQFVQERLNGLQFAGLHFQDMIYVNGLDIRDNDSILPNHYNRPVQELNSESLQAYLANNDPLIRYYKWIRVHYASDSLILSVFLRFSLRGNNLFTEHSRFLLTPPADAYRELDNRRQKDDEKGWLRRIIDAILKIIGYVVMAPFSLIGGVFLPLEYIGMWLGAWMEGRRKRKLDEAMCDEIDENPRYDWGISTSVRDMVSSQRYQHYFQVLDKEMYNKVIERTILDAIVDFLADHRISTTDLKERRTSILNTGIIVQGGNVEAQALAVGEGARAATNEKPAKEEPLRNPTT